MQHNHASVNLRLYCMKETTAVNSLFELVSVLRNTALYIWQGNRIELMKNAGDCNSYNYT